MISKIKTSAYFFSFCMLLMLNCTYANNLKTENVATPLSKDFSPLTGNFHKGSGYLYWETYFELNIVSFDILKSVNGVDWESIGTLKACADYGRGYKYSFVDKQINEKDQYYKIRINHFDGSVFMTNIIVITDKGFNTEKEFVLFPIPVNSNSELRLRGLVKAENTYRIQVLNSFGETLLELNSDFRFEGGNIIIPTSGLSRGSYELIVEKIEDNSKTRLSFLIIN